MEMKKKKNEAVESHAGPAQSRAEDISANHAPDLEEIRLGAHEIHLERGGRPGNELEDWLQAERELQRAAPLKARQFLVAGRG
ncbi:MAG: hypothetical protein QOF56_2182 [Acidobacteriaceae bacterium]|jgi:hypothetical protein|nr:hypothetical protein [Acidobacteriaceae bacterium]